MSNVRIPKKGSEKYRVRFYNAEWEHLDSLCVGRLSAIGAANLVSDFLSSRCDDADIAGLMVSHLRAAEFVCIEVDRG